MTEHTLSIDARGPIHQEMEWNNHMYEITQQGVIGRRHVRSVNCSCGRKFDELEQAKEHLFLEWWTEEHLDGDDPLVVGDTIEVAGDNPTFEVTEMEEEKLIVTIDSEGILDFERTEMREMIKQTRDSGTEVTVINSEGDVKAI